MTEFFRTSVAFRPDQIERLKQLAEEQAAGADARPDVGSIVRGIVDLYLAELPSATPKKKTRAPGRQQQIEQAKRDIAAQEAQLRRLRPNGEAAGTAKKLLNDAKRRLAELQD